MAEETQIKLKNETTFKENSFGKKMRHIFCNITLEPMVAFYLLPSMLLEMSMQNLNLDKACRVNLNYNNTVCDALRERETEQYKIEDDAVQELVSQMAGIKVAISSVFPCLMILLFGSWSDRHGKRKPCILIPLCGQILTAFLLMLCVYYNKTPVEMAIGFQALFPAITGIAK